MNLFGALRSFLQSGLGVVSVVTGGLAAIVGLLGKFTKLKELIGYRPLADKIHDAQVRITEAIEFTKKLELENCEASQAMRNKLQVNLNSMLAELADLTDRDSKLRQDPNYGLNAVQRLFLLFEPEGWTAFILHSLAYICMLAIPISMFYKSYLQQQHADVEYVADTLLLACYGALVFRAWALAARRWNYAYDLKPGLWGTIFLLRRSTNKWMMVAQIFFWVSFFWLVESLEDLCLEIFSKTGSPSLAEALLKSLAPLLAMVLCRFWAGAELKYAGALSNPWRRLSIFLRLEWTTLALIACISVSAGSTFLVLRMQLLDESVHQVALVLQSLIVCVASSQLLAVLSRQTELRGQEPVPAKPESAAA